MTSCDGNSARSRHQATGTVARRFSACPSIVSGPRAQAGLTLIELMVAMVLGIVLMGVAMNVFLSTRETHRVVTNLARVQENGRFALEQISQVIRMTGYQGDTAAQWVLGPLTLSTSGVSRLAGTDDDTNGSDTISIAFRGGADNFIKDCHGNNVGVADTVVNQYALSANSELTCGVIRNGGAIQTLVVVDGVESMHIMYGIDSNNDDAADQYVTAANVADMENVVSVRVALLLMTQDTSLAGQIDTRTYTLLDETVYDAATPANDRRLRRIMTATVDLRNHL
jgi:type IV pilus assembly protein PilW